VEEALNPEKIQGISHRRNSMKKLRTAAAAGVYGRAVRREAIYPRNGGCGSAGSKIRG